MKPAKITTTPAENAPGDFEPAHCRYLARRVVEVWHPNGPDAENLKLTVARIRRKGLRVLVVPAPRSIPAPNTTAINEVAP